MRRAARTDANQRAIVDGLRKMGAIVVVTSHVGDGFPDLVVGWRWQTFLFELKDGDKPPSERRMTPAEQHFMEHWKGGPAVVVESLDDAVKALRGGW